MNPMVALGFGTALAGATAVMYGALDMLQHSTTAAENVAATVLIVVSVLVYTLAYGYVGGIRGD